MDLYGLAPFVGAGRVSDPYRPNIMFVSWIWRAKIIRLGVTCWDTTTGLMSTDAAHLADMARVANSQRTVMPVGSCAVVTCDAPEFYRDVLADPLAADLPFRADTLDSFVQHARDQHAYLIGRMYADFPTYDWSDPITSAVDVIDTCRFGNTEAQRVWAYYASILEPNDPTSDGPAELYVTDAVPWRADISRVDEIIATPNDTANYVWRAELAYRTIVYTEATTAFDEAGL